MKLFSILLLALFSFAFVNAQERGYTDINNDGVFKTQLNLLNASVTNPVIEISVNAYDLRPVIGAGSEAVVVDAPEFSRMLKAGAPDLVHFAKSLVIPDNGNMTFSINSSEYFDIPNVNIAPSKGNLLRTVNPDDVDYTFGAEYSQNAFYPSNIVKLQDPYIFRDLRGQVVDFFPFQYNPITKTLRVYTSIVVELKHNIGAGINEFTRNKAFNSVEPEFHQMYSRHFMNYEQTLAKYTPISEAPGNILIISHGAFIPEMQAFIDWKILKGIETEIVDVATIGNTATAIKTYVTNYYNTNGLTFLILVGDFAQVTSSIVTINAPKDIEYAYITGSDHYPEFLVGRLSAETAAQLQTQVQRSIYYEKTPPAGDWYVKNIGIGSSEGPGHNSEYDYTHIRNLQTDLLNYNYNASYEFFQGSQGGLDAAGDPTAADLAVAINSGASSLWYCGHGDETLIVTTNFTSTNAEALTNDNKLPFLYLVACVVGKYNRAGGPCLAEAMLQSTNNNLPTGAIGVYGSTINQSWAPPMTAEDEMVDILTESYTANIKRTFAGIGINGAMKMNDVDADFDMTDTWTIFGDPSLVVRTLSPLTMTASHLLSVPVGTTSFTVDCNVNGAYVALTKDNVILATGYVSGGSVTFTLPGTLTVGDHVNVCATEYNYRPYIGEFEIINNNIPNDASVTAIYQPSGNYACTGIQTTPGAAITNMGTQILTSCNVELYIDGSLIQTISWTGNLPTFGKDTIYFNPVTIQVGTHTVLVKTLLPNGLADGYVINDEKTSTYTAQNLVISSAFAASVTNACAAPLTVTFTNQSQNASGYLWDFGDGTTAIESAPIHVYTQPGIYTVSLVAEGGICGSVTETKPALIIIGSESPIGVNDVVCLNTPASLSATATGSITWYDAQTAGNVIATGSTYDIASVAATTTVYAENTVLGATHNVGPTNNTTNGSVFTAATEHYQIFSVTEACTLVSVSVNASTAGNRTIYLRNSTGGALQSITVNIPVGVSRVTLNFNLTPGTDYRLVGQATPNLYRSNAGLSYPYTINNVLTITGSSASTSPQGYYYYYYDWEVKMPDCVSARTPVVAQVSQPLVSITAVPPTTMSTADGTATVDYISGPVPASFFWSDGQTTQTATGLSTGDYFVTITDVDGCTSIQSVYVDYPVSVNPSGIVSVKVYPVPASDQIYVTAENSVMNQIELLDNLGRILISKDVQVKGIQKIDVSGISSGTYTLKIYSEDGISLRRISIHK